MTRELFLKGMKIKREFNRDNAITNLSPIEYEVYSIIMQYCRYRNYFTYDSLRTYILRNTNFLRRYKDRTLYRVIRKLVQKGILKRKYVGKNKVIYLKNLR